MAIKVIDRKHKIIAGVVAEIDAGKINDFDVGRSQTRLT